MNSTKSYKDYCTQTDYYLNKYCNKRYRNYPELQSAIFETIIESEKGFNGKGTLKGYTGFCVKRRIGNMIKSIKKRTENEESLPELISYRDGYNLIANRDFVEYLFKTVSKNDRDLIYARYWNKMTLAEIAIELGVSKAWIGKRIESILERFRLCVILQDILR